MEHSTRIYLDNAAKTPVDPTVLREFLAVHQMQGNPSSLHTQGRELAALLQDARTCVARHFNARAEEVVFCATGSEANTLAIVGCIEAISTPGHIVTTPIEHPSVLGAVQHAVACGWSVSYAPVDGRGLVDPTHVARLMTPETKIISIGFANHEIGTVQPIGACIRAVREHCKVEGMTPPYFHTDACQAVAYMQIDVHGLGIDMMTINGTKLHAPSGSAALFVRSGIRLSPQVFGGDQERGLRAGTENVAGAVVLAKALELATPEHAASVRALRDYLFGELPKYVQGHLPLGAMGEDRIAHNVCFALPGERSEDLVLRLDAQGFAVSSGSACTAHSTGPSHVVQAIRVPSTHREGVLRITLSRMNTQTEVDAFLEALGVLLRK